ncbi:uncharacterized protein CDAR_412631 [Caerostris darwini]|uniref:Uncharacterized protein n=1 Tax=Caerostris darwini TaxID=1538125 RepID=A0AAV4QII6_9ARAC|nr:uncharacterized protein CDAR_412631 [Caerostris darwini]
MQENDGSASTIKWDDSTRRTSAALKQIFDDEFRSSLNAYESDSNIEEKYKELSGYLRRESDEFDKRQTFSRATSYSGKTKDILDYLNPKYIEKYKKLQRLVSEWKTKREAIIERLTLKSNQLDRNFKLSTIIRLIASSIEVSGTVGGLMFESESGWAKYALTAASFCGLCGLFSTVVEVDQSKRILDEVSEGIQEDHELLRPIIKLFEETEELDSVVQELFPHGINTGIVRQIQAASEEQADYLKIFKAGLMSNARKTHSSFIGNIPSILDLGRMALQMEFGQMQSIVFQSIPSLPLEQQRLTSLPVAGRIMLNLMTFYDSLVDLRKGAKSAHSDKLRKQLRNMSEQLQLIEDTTKMETSHKSRFRQKGIADRIWANAVHSFSVYPALPLEQQRLTSLPVAGRIMLNLMTFYDSLIDLRKGAKSVHSDKLRKQLRNMPEELQLIEDTANMVEPHEH